MGFGAGATGGSTLTLVSTASALTTAARAGGKRIQLTSNSTYDVGGWLDIAPDTTIESAPGVKGVIKGGALIAGGSNYILRNVAFRPSDLSGNAGDIDAIFLNGLQGPTSNVLIQNVTAIWGPDIGGIAVLGDVNDVTVQCSIIGEGVRLSAHHEGAPPAGHSMGFSVFQLNENLDPADRLTITRNLITSSDRRMPVIHGSRQTDLVNNVVYNWGRNGPDGNPRGINIVGNVMKAGPLTLRFEAWRSRPHSANPCCYTESVYLSDNLAVGFAYSVDSSGAYLRSTPAHALSVSPIPSSQVMTFVAANAGPSIRDAHETRIVNNMVNGAGGYLNGQNYPAPNPTWN